MASVSYKAPVNPRILKWARESLAINVERAAKTALVDPDRYKKWEYGEDLPTVAMLRRLANLYKRPMAVFFMPEVPEDPPLPQDFRTAYGDYDTGLSTEAKLAIRNAMWYQSIARDLMREIGYDFSSDQGGVIDIKAPIDDIVKKERRLDIDDQLSWADNWEALRNWRQYLEDQGLFVFQMSMPSNEIRGFSLLRDNYPPAIVINSKDTPNGRIFTLFHEYGHFLLDTAGICLPEEVEFRDHQTDSVEQFCNEFAGRFLVPTEPFVQFVDEFEGTDLFELIYSLSRKFTVSTFVILRRLYAIERIDYDTYQQTYKILWSRVKKTASSGGDFYKNKITERGKKLVSLVVEAESGNRITTSKALEILDIKLNHYNRIIDMLYE